MPTIYEKEWHLVPGNGWEMEKLVVNQRLQRVKEFWRKVPQMNDDEEDDSDHEDSEEEETEADDEVSEGTKKKPAANGKQTGKKSDGQADTNNDKGKKPVPEKPMTKKGKKAKPMPEKPMIKKDKKPVPGKPMTKKGKKDMKPVPEKPMIKKDKKITMAAKKMPSI